MNSSGCDVSAFAADLFSRADLGIEDLLLLEAFQIEYLPGWVPEREFAAVLHAYPMIYRFLRRKHPPITAFLDRLVSGHVPATTQRELKAFEQTVLKTIVDLLVYDCCPEVYDSAGLHQWDFREITSIATLNDKVVLDVGAGTGRVALEAARFARHVFAIEPVARLRTYIRHKAAEMGLSNLFAVDGFLHSIPFPDDFADLLITSYAIAWHLEDELRECERVVRAGGHIVHRPLGGEDVRAVLLSPEWGYQPSSCGEADGQVEVCWKEVGR